MPERREPDTERVQRRSERRQHERTEDVEAAVERAGDLLAEQKYPTTSEELASEYADEPLDLPNETESLGSVFDRLVDEEYATEREAREALYGAITGPAGPDLEYNEGRDLDALDDAAQEDTTESGASDM